MLFRTQIDLKTYKMTKSWSVTPKYPRGISVSSTHTVLVAVQEDRSVFEYSDDGTLIKRIRIQTDYDCGPKYVVCNYYCAAFVLYDRLGLLSQIYIINLCYTIG